MAHLVLLANKEQFQVAPLVCPAYPCHSLLEPGQLREPLVNNEHCGHTSTACIFALSRSSGSVSWPLELIDWLRTCPVLDLFSHHNCWQNARSGSRLKYAERCAVAQIVTYAVDFSRVPGEGAHLSMTVCRSWGHSMQAPCGYAD